MVGVFGGTSNNTLAEFDDIKKTTIIYNAIATPVMPIYTGGANDTVPNGARGIYYDPPTTVTSATVTTCSAPVDGQEILILFGGTITGAAGAVVTTLSIAPYGAQTLLGTYPVAATTDTRIGIKYRTVGNLWYRIQ